MSRTNITTQRTNSTLCSPLDYSLQDGVVKLEETGKVVKGLKRELTQLQPLLESKAMEAEGLLKQVRALPLGDVCIHVFDQSENVFSPCLYIFER